MRPTRSFFFRLALLGVLSASAFGQSKTLFDPARDLPGFEAVRSSEFKDLFPLDKYSEMLGNELDAAALEKTRAEWTAESSAVQKHLDEIRTNPPVGARWLLDQRLTRHKFFSRVGLIVDDSTPPFLIFVQKPSLDDPKYAPAIVKMFMPFLTKLDAQFEARIAGPAGAPRRADRPFTPIAILASSGDLQNYDKRGNMRDSFTAGARTDADLGLVVGFVNSFDEPKASVTVVYPVLREAYASIWRAHLAPGTPDNPSLWLQEGLASTFAYPRGGQPDGLEKPEVRGTDLKLLVDTCHDANKRTLLLFPVSKLVALHNWDDLVRAAFSQSGRYGSNVQLDAAFLAQSALWMQFLFVRPDGKYHANFERFIGQVLKGTAAADSFTQSFAGVKPEDLDREFWAWVYDEHARAFPSAKIDRDDLKDLFAAPVEAVDEIAAKARASVGPDAPAAPAEPPFDPALLAITDKEVEAQHGLALLAARSGDFESAQKSLTALAKIAAVPDSGRIARDLDRLAAAIRMRDNILGAMVPKQQHLNVDKDGKKLSLAVSGVDKGQVAFAENKSGVKSIPITSVDPAELVRLAERKEMPGDAPQWTRAWLMLLIGDARWDKSFKVDSDAARDLREDGKVWYAERLSTGEAARIVSDLSKKTSPKTRAEAEPIVKGIETLMSKHATAPCVLFKKSGLQKLARAALAAMSAEAEPAELVHGKMTAGENGAVTLVYDFKDEAEALDFQLVKGYLEPWHKTFTPVNIPEAQSIVEVKDGNLRARGAAFWRLPLGFAAPLTITIDYDYPETKGEMHPTPFFSLIVCDDGRETYTAVQAHGDIHVRERETGRSGDAASLVKQFFFDHDYTLVASIDAGKVKAMLEDKVVASGQAGANTKGSIGLFVRAETDIVFHHLEITGKPDPATLGALRRQWAESKLAKMGF